MSLLGPHRPVCGWFPAEALPEPAGDAAAITALVQVAADLVRRGGRWHTHGRTLSDVQRYLRQRLEEGRVEAALVRRALGLPMSATTEETVERARALAAQPTHPASVTQGKPA